ncbi:hypothetical protein B0H16DRAFT_1699332 [Mycena metata]|uniref:Uncharacterized protein n=1 Tax=Mycena metata TaxID=1033252 RepID=A0AAD7MM21_9AGAR|nr:hypothetical protein B0H16DRAFT_1699332 [Mycena metata]
MAYRAHPFVRMVVASSQTAHVLAWNGALGATPRVAASARLGVHGGPVDEPVDDTQARCPRRAPGWMRRRAADSCTGVVRSGDGVEETVSEVWWACATARARKTELCGRRAGRCAAGSRRTRGACGAIGSCRRLLEPPRGEGSRCRCRATSTADTVYQATFDDVPHCGGVAEWKMGNFLLKCGRRDGGNTPDTALAVRRALGAILRSPKNPIRVK